MLPVVAEVVAAEAVTVEAVPATVVPAIATPAWAVRPTKLVAQQSNTVDRLVEIFL